MWVTSCWVQIPPVLFCDPVSQYDDVLVHGRRWTPPPLSISPRNDYYCLCGEFKRVQIIVLGDKYCFCSHFLLLETQFKTSFSLLEEVKTVITVQCALSLHTAISTHQCANKAYEDFLSGQKPGYKYIGLHLYIHSFDPMMTVGHRSLLAHTKQPVHLTKTNNYKQHQQQYSYKYAARSARGIFL